MKNSFSILRLASGALLLSGLTFSLVSVAQAVPETATSADSFVDSFGVNVKLDYLDTPYGDFPKFKQKLLQSGIRHIRVGPTNFDKLSELAAAGIRFTWLMQPSRPEMSEKEWQDEILSSLRPVQQWVVAVEGPNEPDGGYISQLKPFPDAVIAYQKLLYQTVKADPQLKHLPVIVPSIAYPPSSAKVPNQPGDYANIHSYHGSRSPETGEVNLDLPKFYLGNAALQAPGKTVICTEFGSPTNQQDDPNLWMPRISEWSQAKYTLRTFCHYYAQGIPRSFVHEFVDEHPVPNVAEANFGLLRNDWSPKPVFTGLSRLTKLLSDPAPAGQAPVAKLESLDFELQTGGADVRHLLLQKRNGNFYLILWQPAKSYDPDLKLDIGVADAPVTVRLSTPISHALIYSPMHFERAGAPFKNPREVAVGVPDYPIVLELIPRGPDLVVTDFGPTEPLVAGKPARFSAKLKNIGSAMTPPNTVLAITFSDKTKEDGRQFSYVVGYDALQSGQESVLVEGGYWTPPAAGTYIVEALADDIDRVGETNEANNTLRKTFIVAAAP